MKKHLSLGQIKWVIIIYLLVELVTNFGDAIRGFKAGWNSLYAGKEMTYKLAPDSKVSVNKALPNM